jgi:hypothetical protein
VSIGSTAVGERFIISVYEDGLEAQRGTDVTAAAAIRYTLQVNAVVSADAGQTYDIRVHQVNGTARTLDSNSVLCYVNFGRAY